MEKSCATTAPRVTMKSRVMCDWYNGTKREAGKPAIIMASLLEPFFGFVCKRRSEE